MADLEFLVTNGAYISACSERATYIDGSKRERAVLVVPDQVPNGQPGAAEVSTRGVEISVRIRRSELAQPCKGDRVIYHDREHCVEGWDELNIAEWLLYVST